MTEVASVDRLSDTIISMSFEVWASALSMARPRSVARLTVGIAIVRQAACLVFP
jgi:hypothetical protein